MKNKAKADQSPKPLPKEEPKPVVVLDPKERLKKAMVDIEDRVTEQASQIMNRHKSKTNSDSQLVSASMEMSRSFEDLRREQNSIREKLREIKQMQKSIRPKRKQYSGSMHVKSNAELKKLTRQYRKFKQSIEEKTRLIQQQQEEEKIKIKQLNEEHMRTQCQERRKKIEEQLKAMEKRRKQRAEEHEIEKQKLKELRKQKLFEKMKENFTKKMNDLNQEKTKQYEERKKGFYVEMEKLSEYQKRYEQERQEKQEKRTLRLAESRMMLPRINSYKSKFHQNMLEHDKAEKKRQDEMKQRAKMVVEKHKNYQEMVREYYVPTVKETDENERTEEQRYIMDWEEMRRKGNEYLKQGSKYAVPVQKRKQFMQSRILQQKQAEQSLKKSYPNYLREISQQNAEKNKSKQGSDPNLARLKKTLASQELKGAEKAQQLKSFMEMMPYSFSPNHKDTQQHMLDKIDTKIKILHMLH